MYRCLQCEANLELPGEMTGQEFRCPKCGQVGVVPPPIPSQSSLHTSLQVPPVIVPPSEEETKPLRFLRNTRSDAEMDMTPMVDVVFLLLIFFMITAAFGLQKSIEIPDPESDQSSQQAPLPKDQEKTEEDIVIHITKEDKIFVEDEEATTQQELYAKLREHRYQGTQQHIRHLLVQAESEATHETVVRVLDAAAGVGLESVRLMTID